METDGHKPENKGAVAGFLPNTESNLWTVLGVEICKLFYYRPHLQKRLQICVARCVGYLQCSDQKRDKKVLQI